MVLASNLYTIHYVAFSGGWVKRWGAVDKILFDFKIYISISQVPHMCAQSGLVLVLGVVNVSIAAVPPVLVHVCS